MFLRVVREVIVPFWYLVVAGIALMGLTTAINLAPPWLMKCSSTMYSRKVIYRC